MLLHESEESRVRIASALRRGAELGVDLGAARYWAESVLDCVDVLDPEFNSPQTRLAFALLRALGEQ
jgi:hypothetical protein